MTETDDVPCIFRVEVPSSGSDAKVNSFTETQNSTFRSSVTSSTDATLRFLQINIACGRLCTWLQLLLACSACGPDLQFKHSHLATITPINTDTITSHSTTIPLLVKYVCVCVCVCVLHTSPRLIYYHSSSLMYSERLLLFLSLS